MFTKGQKVKLKTYDELAKQFGIGGEGDLFDIMTDPPITDVMQRYLK